MRGYIPGMGERHGSGTAWLVPASVLLLTVVAAVSWGVVRPGAEPFTAPSARASEVVREASATFFFDDGTFPYESARIDVRREGDTLTGTAFATERGRAERPLGSHTCPAAAACGIVVDQDLSLALLPEQARDVGSLANARVHVQYLDGVELTAVAVERERGTRPDTLVWRGTDGILRESDGAPIAEVQVSAGPYAITIFEAPSLHLWGYFDRRNGVWVARALGAKPVDLVATAGTGTFDGQRFAEASWAGLLPVGARDPKLVTGPGVVWQVAPLATTGRLALAVFVDSARASATGIRSITYTDAAGARRTVRP